MPFCAILNSQTSKACCVQWLAFARKKNTVVERGWICTVSLASVLYDQQLWVLDDNSFNDFAKKKLMKFFDYSDMSRPDLLTLISYLVIHLFIRLFIIFQD